MQIPFAGDPGAIAAFRTTISEAIFSTYLAAAQGDPVKALELYDWNSKLSQAIYLPLQMWEISLRNKLNSFLIWKYNPSWPYEERFLRRASKPELRRLNNTKARLTPKILGAALSTDQIVADLSAGFWVSLLTKSYDVPFAWRYNLTRVFPNLPNQDREKILLQSAMLLDLRNRVAHHEPIFHRPLATTHAQLLALIGGMCAAAASYLQATCSFTGIWNQRP